MIVSRSVKNVIKRSHCLELLPDQHMADLRESCGIAMAGRFRAGVLDAWHRIPLSDRAIILVHWKAGSTVCLGWSPVIEITRDWPGVTAGEVARTDRAGHRSRFRSGRIELSPGSDATRAGVTDLSKKQLALVWQYASAAKRGDHVAAGDRVSDLPGSRRAIRGRCAANPCRG